MISLFCRRAKELISQIIARGQGAPDPNGMGDGSTMVEIMIPGNKVGLVIGKGGETIRQLQVSIESSSGKLQ